MDLNTLISRGLDENKLKCISCQNYLSHFPIAIYSNNQNVCGRCETLEGIVCSKNEAFEALCQFLYFPCRYKADGCREEFLPEDVPQHERNCQYRVVTCIVKNPADCNWSGCLPLLYSHCRKEHSEMILKNGEFELDLSVSQEKQRLIEKRDYFFLIFSTKFDCEKKVLSYAIHYDQYQTDCDSRTYQLKIQNEDAILSLNLNTTNYKDVVFKNWCLKSLIGNNNTSQISLKISTAEEENVVVETKPPPMSEETKRELLLLLNCVKCCQLTRPPFYICNYVANPLCQSCQPIHVKGCVFCQIAEACKTHRDTSFLERVSKLVYYPCQYKKKGCSSELKLDQIDSHQSDCQYRNSKCPLKKYQSCKWKGLKKGITNHLLRKHNDIISTGSTFEAVLKPDDVKEKCAIINLSNVLFLVVYCTDDDEEGEDYMWMVQTIDEQDFMYEIEIIDDNHSGRRLLWREKCLKIFHEEFCYFDIEQVRDFCKADQAELKFKIHIIK